MAVHMNCFVIGHSGCRNPAPSQSLLHPHLPHPSLRIQSNQRFRLISLGQVRIFGVSPTGILLPIYVLLGHSASSLCGSSVNAMVRVNLELSKVPSHKPGVGQNIWCVAYRNSLSNICPFGSFNFISLWFLFACNGACQPRVMKGSVS